VVLPNPPSSPLCRQQDASTFALAASLLDLDLELGMQSEAPSAFRVLAHGHFEVGSSMLIECLSNDNAGSFDHLALLASFLYVYIYMARQTSPSSRKIGRLSQTVLNHIRKFSIDMVFSSRVDDGRLQGVANQLKTPAQRSLLGLLLFWLYKEDASLSFYGCGGMLSSYFRPHLTSTSIRDIWDIARPAVQLNWGKSYPPSQALKDLELSQAADMMVELVELRGIITGRCNTPFPGPLTAETETPDDIERSLTRMKKVRLLYSTYPRFPCESDSLNIQNRNFHPSSTL
jgi:hypothetical protein